MTKGPFVPPTQKYPLFVRRQDSKKEAWLICTANCSSIDWYQLAAISFLVQLDGRRRFKTSRPVGELVIMPVKLLLREKNELRLRIIGESHTALQMLRERLNNHKNVEYANYFPGHPELDDPEFYIRTKGKNASDKVLRDLVAGLAVEFSSITL